MPVVDSLRSKGISVWVDEGNIHAADLWSEQIVQAIADCRVMVVMLSQNSTDSHNVVKEVMLASEQKKALLPVYLEPSDVPAKLQYQLAGIQHLELYGQDDQQVLKDLENGLAKHGISLEGEATTVQSTTINHHDKPNTRKNQSKNYFKKLTKSSIAISICISLLVGFFFIKLDSEQIIVPSESNLPRLHLKITIPDEYPLAQPSDLPFGVPSRMISISPNGKFFAYVCAKEEHRYIAIINLQDSSQNIYEESKDGLFPFFSPDEKWIGFVTPNKVNKIEISSGLIKEICSASNPYYGAVWGNDGMIYFGDSEGMKFLKVSDKGGVPKLVTDKVRFVHDVEYISTTKGANLIFRSPGPNITRGPFSVYSFDSSNGDINQIANGYMPSAYGNNIVTIEDGQARSMKFDRRTFKIDSEIFTLFNTRIRYSDTGSQFAMSKNNVIVFLSGNSSLKTQLTTVDPITDKIQTLFDREEIFGQYSISPNGEQIALEVVNNQFYNIYILNIKRSRLSSITASNHNYAPFWSPDGSSIYYTSNREDLSTFDIYKYEFAKNSEQKIILNDDQFKNLCISDVSKDGRNLLCFGLKGAEISSEIYLMNIETGKQVQLTNNKLEEWGAVFSEDGNWIAYTSEKDMQGSYAIYINKFPQMDQEIRISAGGGEEPKWLPDGSGVYYRNGSKWLKVALNFEGEIEIGEPKLFFEGDYINVWGPSHDVFPDGRILLLKGDKWLPPKEVDVIINALEE